MPWGARNAEPDPNPGIGGYTRPRGPAGEDGYPGSTGAVRENPPAAAGPLRRPWRTFVSQQANVVPPPAQNGSLPFQGPDAKTNPGRARDTEDRHRTVISAGGKGGGERQRNTIYRGGLAAQPGQARTTRSAPRGRHGEITEVQVPSRYVFGGVNGGTDLLRDSLQHRRMPYTGHGPGSGQPHHARGSIRGAVLNGNRFYQAPDTELNQGGAYGRRVRGHQRHRPTVFTEPAPWSGQFYDTTADSGGPDSPGANTQVVQNVHVSPSTGRRPARRSRGW